MTRRLFNAVAVVTIATTACVPRGAQVPQRASVDAAEVSADRSITIAPDSPQLTRIGVMTVKTARVASEVVVAPGKIEADPSLVSKVVMPVAGRVTRVMVRLGDAVSRGAPLLTIESPEIGATVSAYRQAQARVSEARAGQTKADADLARARDLFENRAIAQKDVLAAQSAAVQANADVTQAESAVVEARKKLEIFGLQPESADQTTIVRAPVGGKVLDLTVVAGEYRTDTTIALMTIADLSSVFMAADVPETEIRLIRPGIDVEVTLAAYPDETFHATVSRVADTVDPQTRTIKVRSTMSNPNGRLRPEMFGQIQYAADFQLLPVIPTSAIIHDDERTQVFVEEGRGRFRPVPVVLGNKNGEVVAVTRGLKPGDRVVVDGAMLLVRH
jgi:cobalt-zinc-cadmium efflux system membrane fusion protein